MTIMPSSHDPYGYGYGSGGNPLDMFRTGTNLGQSTGLLGAQSFPTWMGGAGSSGGGMLGSLGPAGLFAALISMGKMTENRLGPDNPASKVSLAMLGPSIKQVMADPKGIGLPTLLGAPFLAPFTGKKEARAEAPEWAPLMGKGG